MPNGSLSFLQVLQKTRGEGLSELPRTVLAIDPGGTTGYAVFQDLKPYKVGQCTGTHMNMHKLLTFFKPDAVVCEDYLVYPWALREHKWSRIPTLRLIGGIESQCMVLNIPLHLENAQAAKGFVTDQRLKSWGLYEEGKPHARDAIRHACYYLTFKHTT